MTALNLQIEAEEARQAELKFREEQLTEEMNVLQAALLAMTKARQSARCTDRKCAARWPVSWQLGNFCLLFRSLPTMAHSGQTPNPKQHLN